MTGKAYMREYRAKNKTRMAEVRRSHESTPCGKASVLRANAVQRAKKRGLPVEIDVDWIATRIERGCPLTGAKFDLSYGPTGPLSPSIDRIDSSEGYTPNNCRVIVWALNAAFCNWGEDAFRQISLPWFERSTASNLSHIHMAA